MEFRDIALTSLRSIRKAAVDLLTIIRNRRLDRGDTYPQSHKASDSQIKVMDALGVLAKALYELPSGFMAYERFLPPEMTEAEAEALIQRHLDNPNKYGGKLTPEEERRTTEAWIESVRQGTKPIPDARPMLVGEEFLDADEAHKLLYAVHSSLCSAGWQRCDIRPPPVKVEAAVVEKLERGIELLSRFEEQAGGAVVADQAGGKPPEDQADEDREDWLDWSEARPQGTEVRQKVSLRLSKILEARTRRRVPVQVRRLEFTRQSVAARKSHARSRCTSRGLSGRRRARFRQPADEAKYS